MADFNDMADNMTAVQEAEQVIRNAAVQSGNPNAAGPAINQLHNDMRTQKMPQGMPPMQNPQTQKMNPSAPTQQQQPRPQSQQSGAPTVKAQPKAYGPTGGFSYFHEDPNRSGWFSKGNSSAKQVSSAGGKDIGLILSIGMVITASVAVWVLGAHTSIDYLISRGFTFLGTAPWSIIVWLVLGGISAFEIRFCPISWRGLWHISLARPQDGVDTVMLILWFVIAGVDVGTNQKFVDNLMKGKLEITLFGPDFIITGWLLGVVIMSISFLIAFVTEPMIRKLWPRFIYALKA